MQQDDIVVLRLDVEEGDPYLIFPSGNSILEDLSYGVRDLSEGLARTIKEIAEKAIMPREDRANDMAKLSDRDTKIYLKQAFINYLLLLVGDLRPFMDQGS